VGCGRRGFPYLWRTMRETADDPNLPRAVILIDNYKYNVAKRRSGMMIEEVAELVRAGGRVRRIRMIGLIRRGEEGRG
jgi:hypothetical protein